MAGSAIRRVHSALTPGIGRISVTGNIVATGSSQQKPFRILGSYAAVYVLSGQGQYADASGFTADVAAGDMLLVLPDVPHTYGPPTGQTWNELFVVFEGDVFDLWRKNGLLDASPPVRHLEPIDQWAKTFLDIVGTAYRDTPASVLQDVCRLQLLLAEAFAKPPATPQATSADQQWLTQATALLEADIRRDATLDQIAAELAMSYDGFRKRFRRLMGISPARYRSLRSIDRACELMVEGQLTDREIAATLGYCNEFHFSHRFRELTGRPPRQFRATTLPPSRH